MELWEEDPVGALHDDADILGRLPLLEDVVNFEPFQLCHGMYNMYIQWGRVQ